MATMFHNPHQEIILRSVDLAGPSINAESSTLTVLQNPNIEMERTVGHGSMWMNDFMSTHTENFIARNVVPETTVTLSGSVQPGTIEWDDIGTSTHITMNGEEYTCTNLTLATNFNETDFQLQDYTITLTNVGTAASFNIDINMHPMSGRRRCLQTTDGPEAKARLLLKRLVGDTAFRSYLKNGFLSYRGKSGRTYQIFPGEGMTNVWRDGTPVDKLCVIFNGGRCPPTDSVVMRLLLLESSESEFWRMANKFGLEPSRGHQTPQVPETGRILKLAERKARGEIMVEGSKVIIAA